MDSALILQEEERRTILAKAIDAFIILYIQPEKKGLPRGLVQESLLKILGLKRTTELCVLINERMRLAGYRTVTRHGTLVYKE